MLKINRNLEYVIMTLLHLSKKRGELTTSRQIADIHKVPLPFSAKLLQRLSKSHIVQAKKGIGGGYRLQKELHAINLFDLQAILEEDNGIVDCLREKGTCHVEGSCHIMDPMKKLNSILSDALKKITVEEFLKGK